MQQKLNYIVFLRILATVAVVMNHTALVALGAIKVPTFENKVIVQTIVHIVHFAVPIFVMITGALLLDEQRIITYKKALLKYAWRMAVILLTVGWGFAMMESFFHDRTISLSMMLSSFINVLEGNSWEHMWYLYMLIGLYMFVPFIKAALKNLTLRSVDCILVILFVFTSVLPMIDYLGNFKFGIKFPITSEYVMYMILGWRITKMSANSWIYKNNILILVIIAIVTLLIGVCPFIEEYYNAHTIGWLDHYNSPVEVILSYFIFSYCYCNQSKFDGIYKMGGGKFLDNNSFGIYIFHMLWINLIYKIIGINPLNYNFMVYIIMVITTIILSACTTVLFRKLPILGKYI